MNQRIRTALITGVTGQDGSYLVELLLSKGYRVHGILRPGQSPSLSEHPFLSALLDNPLLKFHEANLLDSKALGGLVKEISPDECYHLAAESYVNQPIDASSRILVVNILGTENLLKTILIHRKKCKVYFAGTSEMFGNPPHSPQDEETPFNPRNVYGISKAAGFSLARIYREKENLSICGGILYNHESPRRGVAYVTRKISLAVARIYLGLERELSLGNLDAARDWGYAPDYVRAMWMMLQEKTAQDFVIGSGQLHTVRDIAEKAFAVVNLSWMDYVRVDPSLLRTPETVPLRANPARAQKLLGWKTSKSFEEVIQEMVLSDIRALSAEKNSS